jgi:F0F1-type ATP synthase membrane subunit b/b'
MSGFQELKSSRSLKFVARVTGMSVEHAYRLCMMLNFGLLIAAALRLSRTYVVPVFSDRTASIRRALEAARKVSLEASRRLAEVEERLAKPVEIGRMRAAAERAAAEQQSRIKAETEEEIRRVVRRAEQEIAAAIDSARHELKAYVTELAVSLAAHKIRVDAALDRTLAQWFLQQLAAMDTINKGQEKKRPEDKVTQTADEEKSVSSGTLSGSGREMQTMLPGSHSLPRRALRSS